MDHRKTPAGNSLILPLWAIIASVVLCVVGAGYLLAATIGDASDDSTAAASSTVAPSTVDSSQPSSEPSSEPTESEPTESEPTESEPTESEPTESAVPSPTVERDTPVGVYNNTRTRGLAASTADKVEAAGWNVVRIANWRGAIPETTVYYPEGLAKQAKLLARDLDIARVHPAVPSMNGDRLTLILTGS